MKLVESGLRKLFVFIRLIQFYQSPKINKWSDDKKNYIKVKYGVDIGDSNEYTQHTIPW